MKVGLAGSRSETKVVGGWTPRSDNAVLEDVALVEVTDNGVAEVDLVDEVVRVIEANVDDEESGIDEVVRVIEASVDDEESGIDELAVVTGLGSSVESLEVGAIEVVNTAEAGRNEPKNPTWVKNKQTGMGAYLQM